MGLAILLAAAGCGESDPNRPPLVPVRGTVTLDGGPLGGAQVVFVPIGSTRGSGARGYTDQAGRYDLVSGHGPGAAVGAYRVTIVKLVLPDGSDFPVDSEVGPIDSPARQVLLPRYSDLQQTCLTADVVEGGSDKLNFAIASR